MIKWNVYILAIGQIQADEKSAIRAPRIGMCATNITMSQTKVHSNGKGCKAGQGLGAGMQAGFCAGSGASHGGYGGYGGSESNDPIEKAKCLSSFPNPYYFG